MSKAAVRSSSSRFWKTPPESTTVSVEAAAAASAHALAVARARPLWKRAEIAPAGVPRSTSSSDRADRLAGVELAALERQRVGAALGPIGDGLELHRGLAFVGDARPQAAERRDRVEEAAGARRHGSKRRPCEVGDLAPASRIDPPRERTRRARGGAGGLQGPCAGHAPGLVDRLLGPGHPHGAEMPEPLEAGQVADQQLAAPDRPVRAVAGAVVDGADRRARSRRARPGRPRGARGDAERSTCTLGRALGRDLVERYSGCRS